MKRKFEIGDFVRRSNTKKKETLGYITEINSVWERAEYKIQKLLYMRDDRFWISDFRSWEIELDPEGELVYKLTGVNPNDQDSKSL